VRWPASGQHRDWAVIWTHSIRQCNRNSDPIPQYQFQQTCYKMMLLQQTTINRIPLTSNNKNNTQNETEIKTNYTWQLVKKRKRSNQTPETTYIKTYKSKEQDKNSTMTKIHSIT
jgi:hypothetical protein